MDYDLNQTVFNQLLIVLQHFDNFFFFKVQLVSLCRQIKRNIIYNTTFTQNSGPYGFVTVSTYKHMINDLYKTVMKTNTEFHSLIYRFFIIKCCSKCIDLWLKPAYKLPFVIKGFSVIFFFHKFCCIQYMYKTLLWLMYIRNYFDGFLTPIYCCIQVYLTLYN